MALSSETSKTIFVCTGGTVYTVPFYFLQNADLTVYRQDADGNTSTLVLTTDYTLTGAGEESGGELTTIETFSDGKLVVVRNVAYTQGLDLIAGDGFRPDTLEKELDRIVMQVQQLARKVGVSFQLPDSDTSGASTELPSPEAGKVFAWNATGDAIVNEVPQFTVLENGSVTIDKIDADATSAVKGLMRFATDAETITGTETLAATTPANIRAAYDRLFKGYHEGLIISNNAIDPAYDIDVSTGICRDSGNVAFISLASTITKRIDAAWASGTGAGGFPSGLTLEDSVTTRANSTAYSLADLIRVEGSPWWWECTKAGTSSSSVPAGYGTSTSPVTDGTATFTRTAPEWYRVFLISSADLSSVDAGFDTDAAAANLLSDATGYSLFRQIGWVLNNGDGTIVPFFCDIDGRTVWDVPKTDRDSAALTTTASKHMISAPPYARAHVSLYLTTSAGSGTLYGLATELRQTDSEPGEAAANIVLARDSAAGMRSLAELSALVSSGSEIRTRANSTGLVAKITTIGYTFLWG